MVAKAARDRRSISSAKAANTPTNTKAKQVSAIVHDKKKIAKPIGICGFCLGDNEKNANGVPEEMINCAECGNSGHPSCLQYSEKLVEKIRSIHWQCIDCKRCIVCNISDDSLLFCDFCDSGIHPKCCNPPLDDIPKGDFACHLCQDELNSASNKSLPSSPTRSLRNNMLNNEHNCDGLSSFFSSQKQTMNNIRQQSVQKAMKYLRDKKTLKPSNKKIVKRLHSSNLNTNDTKEKNELLAKSILSSSSKTDRMRKKLLGEDLSSNPQTSTPILKRRLSNKKSFTSDCQNENHFENDPVEELTKTPSSRSSNMKKRSKNDSLVKKSQGKNKRKLSQTDDDQSDDDKQNESTDGKRKLHLDISKYKNPPAFLNDELPENVQENDIYLFLESRKDATKLITDCSEKYHHTTESIEEDTTNTRWPPYIVFGTDLIKTWYSSSYPQEYARVPRLYICEFCLKYMKCERVYERHCKKCTAFHPPANEIYHKDDLSVFEVDGNINRIYCQNLCLLAKLFLDHKTLYYDVEPFLFYVLTKNDANGCHFVGYFSKEKHCPQKYNLSCIMVLPNCQRRGYGRFLIELSYLLSQKEGQVGTPERPLSTLGAQTYEAYWKIKIVEQLLVYYNECKQKCLLKSIMNETAITIDDIIETLQNLGVLTMKSNGKPVINADITHLETMIKNEKIKHAHWVSVDGEYLRFTPVMTPLLLINEEKAVEKEVKEIQIVFKQIGRDAAEAAAAASLEAEANDNTNPTETVRYIRRRKNGQKRRSIIVKRRTPINNHKPTKNESIITNDDGCAVDIITNDIDEHSQEYKPRRQVSVLNESLKEQEPEEKTTPKLVSPKLTLKQTSFKQLKLDQFLKVTPAEVKEQPKLNQPSNENAENSEEIHLQSRRITRTTRLNSTSKLETEPVKISIENSSEILPKSDANHQESLTKQTNKGNISVSSSNDNSSTFDMDRPLQLKKRNLTSSDIQALIDSTISPTKNNSDIKPASEIFSSLSDILSKPIRLSINVSEDETNIAQIESQLKSSTTTEINQQQTISSIGTFENSIDDDQPPSLTSSTSMIISQSDHYNYSTRAKQQTNNMTYNYDNTSYPYPYPPTSSYDMPSYYYPSAIPMDYMPYYPTASNSGYPNSGTIYGTTSEQQSYYSTNNVNSISYGPNGATPYIYPTPQPPSTIPTTQNH